MLKLIIISQPGDLIRSKFLTDYASCTLELKVSVDVRFERLPFCTVHDRCCLEEQATSYHGAEREWKTPSAGLQ